MDRKDAIARMARAGLFPGAVAGGIAGLIFTFVGSSPGDSDFMGRLLTLFPLSAAIGAAVGALIGAIIADQKFPP